MYCITFENVVLEKKKMIQLLSFSMAYYKITINVIVWSGNVKRDDIKSYLKMIVMPSYPVYKGYKWVMLSVVAIN